MSFLIGDILGVVNVLNRDSLLRNPNVESVTESHVVYTSEFKNSALNSYEAGISGRIIWLNAGFNLDHFVSGYFRKALKRWKQQSLHSSGSSWTEESRGRKKSIGFASDSEELEYLRAENWFLKELHALKQCTANK